MRELKLRGLVNRTLVIAPKGLVTQWVAEMRTHFGEDFRLLIPSDIPAYHRISRDENIKRKEEVSPEMVPLLLIRLDGGGANG